MKKESWNCLLQTLADEFKDEADEGNYDDMLPTPP